MISKRYLGDSVYAEIENGMIKLTTENGKFDDPSNTIYLKWEVMIQLHRFAIDAIESETSLPKETHHD